MVRTLWNKQGHAPEYRPQPGPPRHTVLDPGIHRSQHCRQCRGGQQLPLGVRGTCAHLAEDTAHTAAPRHLSAKVSVGQTRLHDGGLSLSWDNPHICLGGCLEVFPVPTSGQGPCVHQDRWQG